jgi:spore coat polysaccharide biosynthesis protein SpsF
MTIRTVAIIQARMASSRLPGKVMMDRLHADARPRRGKGARAPLPAVVVAATDEPSDDPIVEYCERTGSTSYAAFDVLDRYYKRASVAGWDHDPDRQIAAD